MSCITFKYIQILRMRNKYDDKKNVTVLIQGYGRLKEREVALEKLSCFDPLIC